jgi:molybdate transport system permease protein
MSRDSDEKLTGVVPAASPAEGTIAGNVMLAIASAVMVIFLLLPLLALLSQGVAGRGWQELDGAGVPQAIVLSMVTTLVSTAIIAVLGTPLAYTLARRSFHGKTVVMVLVQLPLVLPPAVAGLALLVTFGRRGILGGALADLGITLPFTTAAVILAQVFIAAPFFIRAAQVGFAGVSQDVEDAARVDGASGFMLFRAVTLPLAGRSLGAGLVLSWARALGEFGATILFAGSLPGRTQTMPLLVYSVFERDMDAAIWTGLILVGFALAALLLSHGLGRKSTLL